MSLRELARSLRRQMTEPELYLWNALRGKALGGKFRRQAVIGPYIVDFVCLKHRLVVELDGSQHVGSEADLRRDAWLRSEGYRVLRFWNAELMRNRDGVLEAIYAALHEAPPPCPPPRRGEESCRRQR